MIRDQKSLVFANNTQPFFNLLKSNTRSLLKWSSLSSIILFLCFISALSLHADDKTRGIGIYPGRSSESFAPQVVSGGDLHRNLALYHRVYHSSCYDYNLTGQLITDGIITEEELPHIEVLANGKNLPKLEREYTIDGHQYNTNTLLGSQVSLQINWYSMKIDVDSIVLDCTVAYHGDQTVNGYSIALSNEKERLCVDSDDSLPGEDMGYELHSDPNKQTDKSTLPARKINKGYAITTNPLSTLLLTMQMDGAAYWTISDIHFFKAGKPVDTALLPMSQFQSGWMSETGGEQWCYIDLGDNCHIDQVSLYWLENAPKGEIEVSADAENWNKIVTLPEGNLSYQLPVVAEGRYVKVALNGQTSPYMLSEMEVYGTGGTKVVSPAAPEVKGNLLSLNGGEWRLKRAETENWIPATVPATVLSSYINAHAVQDPNYDDDIKYISESYFYSNFTYCREFTLPKEFQGKQVFLNLDGINWKAKLSLNDEPIGEVKGAFTRGKIDITSKLKKDNILVIEIERPDHPGATKEKNYIYPTSNGGLLGSDNPTFHASIGWDWIPTVRGREIGIWNDIYLTAERAVSLSDPLISTTLALPDTLATMTPEVCYHNFSGEQLTGTMYGWIGSMTFQKNLTLDPGMGIFKFSPEEFPELNQARMRLWWPNGYGEPYLYEAGFCFVDAQKGDTLSVTKFNYGVRQVTYKDVETALKIYVNGKRIVPLGGNWGFSEQNLNYRAREYDIAVRYHREMNFNMIRNWVAQIGDKAFYDACDRYGILVWQDFCLANPADGPDPIDEQLFEDNALDYLMKIRNHPSIALYCGRNEGYPPKPIDDYLREIIDQFHPGMGYISSSADDGVSGHGPYNVLPAKEYFSRQTGLFHSERGMPCIMTMESLARTMRKENQWPQNDVWGQHDYTMTGAQRGESFNQLIASRFGDSNSAEEFTSKAQLINYEGYRSMYESGSKDRMGLLIWMSHSCWPSQTWQCYDYYFEPTAAYFGSRKACEPLHIQYNALTEKVEVVNLGVGDKKNLTLRIKVFDLDGKCKREKEYSVDSPDDSMTSLPDKLDLGQDLLCLSLYDQEELVSENRYILADKLTTLTPTNVESIRGKTTKTADGAEQTTTITLENKGDATAYLLRLNLVDEKGNQILPVRYSDNYFHLLPHEKKTVTVCWALEDQQTDETCLLLTGLNL